MREDIEGILKNKQFNEETKEKITTYLERKPKLFFECIKIAIKEQDINNVSFLLSLPYLPKDDRENIFHFLLNNNFSPEIAETITNTIKKNSFFNEDDIYNLLQEVNKTNHNNPLLYALNSKNIDAVKFVCEHSPVFLIEDKQVLDSLFNYFKMYSHEHNNIQDRTDFLILFDEFKFSFDKVSFKKEINTEVNILPVFSASKNLLHYLNQQKGLGLNFIGNLLQTSGTSPGSYFRQNLKDIYNSSLSFSNINKNKIQDSPDIFLNFTKKFIYQPEFPVKDFLKSILTQSYFQEYLNHPNILHLAKKDDSLLKEIYSGSIFSNYLSSDSINDDEFQHIIANFNSLINIYPESHIKFSKESNNLLFDSEKYYDIDYPTSLLTLLIAKDFKYYNINNSSYAYKIIPDIIFSDLGLIKNLPDELVNQFDKQNDGHHQIKPSILMDSILDVNESLVVGLISKYDSLNSQEMFEKYKPFKDFFVKNDNSKIQFIKNVLELTFDEKNLTVNRGSNEDIYQKLFLQSSKNIYQSYLFFMDNYPEVGEDFITDLVLEQYNKSTTSPYFSHNHYNSKLISTIEKKLISKQIDNDQSLNNSPSKRRI